VLYVHQTNQEHDRAPCYASIAALHLCFCAGSLPIPLCRCYRRSGIGASAMPCKRRCQARRAPQLRGLHAYTAGPAASVTHAATWSLRCACCCTESCGHAATLIRTGMQQRVAGQPAKPAEWTLHQIMVSRKSWPACLTTALDVRCHQCADTEVKPDACLAARALAAISCCQPSCA
jgi:hypothetical protein